MKAENIEHMDTRPANVQPSVVFLSEVRDNYIAEYGVREDDDALVIHFFPPEQGWNTEYGIDKRLERAIQEILDTSRVTATYEPEVDSFCIVAGQYGSVPDFRMLVKRFLDAVDK